MANPMITIGHRALLANFPQLQIPKGEELRINFDVHGWKLPIIVVFVDQGTDQAIEVKPDAGGVRLVFHNWTNSLGSALKAPAQLATLADGTFVEFMATNYRIVDTNVLSLQLLHSKVQA
jgi:hypothetical protein